MIERPDTDTSGLLLPDGRIITPNIEVDEEGNQRVHGLMTRSEWDQLQAVLRAKFFLFRNVGANVGERMKCESVGPDGRVRGCGVYHSYITYMCVERPFKGGHGLEEGLYLMFRAAKNPNRRRQLQTAIGRLPDFSAGHPYSAAQWAPKDEGENWLAALVDYPQPISKEDARKFAVRINTEKNPPVRFCLKEDCENYLEADFECAGRAHSYL